MDKKECMKRGYFFTDSWFLIYFFYLIFFSFFFLMMLPGDYSGDYKGEFYYWFFINVLGFPLLPFFEILNYWPEAVYQFYLIFFVNSVLFTTILNFLYQAAGPRK